MLTVKQLLEREDFFDAAIVRHGFTDYMRDYEVYVSARNGPPNTDNHLYQFVGCVEAVYKTELSPELFNMSLPDEFVLSGPDYPDKDDPDGFIWGVRFAETYPGWTYVENGDRAQEWSKRLNRPMHELLITTGAYSLTLVFIDLRYKFLGNSDSDLPPRSNPVEVSPLDRTVDGEMARPGL